MGSMRAAFTGTRLRCDVFLRFSEFMDGVDCFWIMPGAADGISALKKAEVRDDHILSLSRDFSYDHDTAEEIEKFSAVTISYIIQSDRILSKKNPDYAMEYVCGVYSAVKDFLRANDVSVVFSEATWAFELVTCAACRSLGIAFLVPHTVRIPEGRFGFFEGIFQNKLAHIPSDGIVSISAGTPDHQGVNRGFNIIAKAQKFVSHLMLTVTCRDRDETRDNVFNLVKRDVRRACRAYLSGFGRMSVSVEGRYVYMPLHCQPEASVDVLGGFYSDQLWLVRAVSRALPAGIILAVKEHPHGVGCRPAKFFRELRRLPNVVCVSPYADGRQLTANASAVVSVSGTACYEAALAGVGSVVFTDVFFGQLPAVVRCSSPEDIGRCISEAQTAQYDKHTVQSFMADILSCTFSGYVGTPDVCNGVMKEENARAAAQAFVDVVRYYSSSEEGICMAASMSSRCS